MSVVEKHEVVAAAVVKMFKEIVEKYKGPENRFRAYLLRELKERDAKADAILAYLVNTILDQIS